MLKAPLHFTSCYDQLLVRIYRVWFGQVGFSFPIFQLFISQIESLYIFGDFYLYLGKWCTAKVENIVVASNRGKKTLEPNGDPQAKYRGESKVVYS